MRLVHFGQQFDVGLRVPAREPVAPIRLLFYLAAFDKGPYKSCHLSTAQARDFATVGADQSPGWPPQPPIPVLPPNSTHPFVDLRTTSPLKLGPLRPVQK